MGQRAALLSAAYTSGDRFEEGKEDLAFRTKPQLALTLIESALAAGVTFKAIVADAFQGEHIRLARIFTQRGLPYVLSHSGQKKLGRGSCRAGSFVQGCGRRHVAARLACDNPSISGWPSRTLVGYCPNKPVRAICATTDRRTMPEKATWYLTTNLTSVQASLAEVVRLYGLRI
jgi:hypothetical protein